MFDTLLEKQDKIIFHLFQYLQKKNPCPLKEVSTQLNLSSKSLSRYVKLWQQSRNHDSTGVSFSIKNQVIEAIYSHENAQLFLSSLLNRSDSFKLLVKIIENPFDTFKSLEKRFYLSRATLQRRVQKMKPLLSNYNLWVSFTTTPTLKGEEIQIRYFSLLVSLLYDPPFELNAQNLYDRYKEVQQYRITQGFSFYRSIQAPGKYYPVPFQINDFGLLFLWQQFTGLENLWLEPFLTEAVDFSLYAHTKLKEITLLSLSQRFHRLHSFCDFYSGSLLLAYEPLFLTNEIKQLTYSFIKLLPNYRQLLIKHPELPVLYEKLLQYSTQKEKNKWNLLG
ncbi:hypothetical protein C7K38_04780 [Tetragenococcus osmophilus]|uniref:Mga helix-turn-helix domain-containing protein n=1 Tax=Tetragenococcus osmophilus TaxID=526944 RepID=A0AA37XKV3_9ENTE|nr:helix-turn-helix domain-containing protein [Tetragenococcus osmophilus]AYW47749.1 hypothetical protein C7K38_04780 [Tetragenococcus osmophilus]GMA53417.1 hypothetical protein GCM10025857_47740 [Alicyclobacillus contaminans]GMA72632.1 hypothetical protein GCM10025885_16810 [Tetragenococcus osmophilus]